MLTTLAVPANAVITFGVVFPCNTKPAQIKYIPEGESASEV